MDTSVAIITDTHFGIKSDSIVMLDNFKKFYENVFFPELKKRNIKTIFHLGDLVDRRKYINFNTLNRLKLDFLNYVRDNGYEFHVIAGNHDVFYKNTNSLNIYNEVLEPYNFKVYSNPQQIQHCGYDILLLPWITSDNETESFEMIEKTTAQICFGHLELIGFEMDKGNISNVGYESDMFKKFDVVLSGHYHMKSAKDNIHYLGSPYEMSWIDYNTKKGFHIFDFEKRKLTFIKNPYTIYNKIVYNDTEISSLEEFEKNNNKDFRDTYCRIDVIAKTNPLLFDQCVSFIEDQQPEDLKIIDNVEIEIEDSVVIESENTLEVLNRSVDSLETHIDKNKIKSLMNDLYAKSRMVAE